MGWMAPKSNGLYETGNFDAMKAMYEDLYNLYGRASYSITISQGGTIMKTFLQNMEQAWKDKCIAGWLSYSGVFAGASDMAYSQLSGESYYSDIVQAVNPLNFSTFTPEEFRQATQGFPGQATVSP